MKRDFILSFTQKLKQLKKKNYVYYDNQPLKKWNEIQMLL